MTRKAHWPVLAVVLAIIGVVFVQSALPGCEDEWPFESDFWTDVTNLGEREYYPRTLDG